MSHRILQPFDLSVARFAAAHYADIVQAAHEGHAEHGRGMVWLHIEFASDGHMLDEYTLSFIDAAGIAEHADFRDMASPFFAQYNPNTSFILALEWCKTSDEGLYQSFICGFDEIQPSFLGHVEALVGYQKRDESNLTHFIDTHIANDPAIAERARQGYRQSGRGVLVIAAAGETPNGINETGHAWVKFTARVVGYFPATKAVDGVPADIAAKMQRIAAEYRPAREMVLSVAFTFPNHIKQDASVVISRRPLSPKPALSA